jgi:hypothetical protein
MNDIATAGLPASNIGAYVKAVTATKPTKLGAATGGSGVQIVGETIDRLASKLPLSARLAILVRTTLASGQTLSIAPVVETKEEVADSYAQYGDNVAAQVVTANDDGSEIVTELHVDVDLAGAKQYVRFSLTPTLTHSGSDVAYVGAAAVLGGFSEQPQA